MPDRTITHRYPECTTYRVENRQFIIHRTFGTEKTVSDLLTAELSSGLLQSSELSV